MNQHNDQAQQAAERFFADHAGEHLDADRQQLIDRCTTHLMESFALSARAAEDVAMRAACAREARHDGVYIDTDRTTAHGVVIYDPVSKSRQLITVGDLTALLQQRQPRWYGVDLGTADVSATR